MARQLRFRNGIYNIPECSPFLSTVDCPFYDNVTFNDCLPTCICEGTHELAVRANDSGLFSQLVECPCCSGDGEHIFGPIPDVEFLECESCRGVGKLGVMGGVW